MYRRRLRLIIECWTEWAMTWIVQEEFYPEPWINLRWCLKPNQAAGCLRSWHLLWLFSLSYTILLDKRLNKLARGCSMSLHGCEMSYPSCVCRDVSECNMHLNVWDGQRDILVYLLENM